MPRHLVLRGDRTWLLASVGERAVEVDGEVGAVAERLVPGLAAAAQGHRVRVRDLPAVDIGQAYRPRYQVGAVLAGVIVTSGMSGILSQKTLMVLVMGSWRIRVPVRAAMALVRAGAAVSYTHLRAHETRHDLVCRL